MRNARVDAERGHRAAVRGDHRQRIQRTKLQEQFARLSQRGSRRWIEPAELEWVNDTSQSEIECERGEVGRDNLRHGTDEQCRLLAG